ncbi:ABC transporter permease [soil metagenome]
MFRYYLDLALRSFRKSRALTALMVIALGLGIGATMTTLTIFHVLSGDPIPGKSDRLFMVGLDPRSLRGFVAEGEPLEQVTRFDAETLLRDKHGKRQVMMNGSNVAIEPEQSSLDPFYADARNTSGDFFAMFETPFLFGSGWSPDDDATKARVTVISRELNDKLFAGADSIGKPVRMNGQSFRIVGVLDTWRPVPHYYDLNTGRFSKSEMVYVPFSTARELKMSRNGSMTCWGGDNVEQDSLNASCAWLQYWVELDDAAQAGAFRDYLVAYSEEQRRAGRFERAPNVRLRSVMQWLDFKKVVPGDVKLQVWLAFGFLLVCLVNTVGLLLAKCLRRAGEIGVRRALGASRREIFGQFLVEAGVIGIAGGLLGLALALGLLWLVRQGPGAANELARLDGPMLLATLALALLASVLAGLLPAWRACQITPALQLKSQ